MEKKEKTPVEASTKNENKRILLTKKILKIIDHFRSPLAIGIYICFVFLFLAFNFYDIRSKNKGAVHRNPIFTKAYELVELMDLKSQDLRFQYRKPIKPEARVGLLTIDDRSIEEVARWPWSREIVAQVIDEMMKYGAKAIGFDIVFSEPQNDPTLETLDKIEGQVKNLSPETIAAFAEIRKKGHPDKIFAETLNKYRDRLILGAFNDDATIEYRAYQDYCRNEAFKRANADKFVKLNATFMVNDEADDFVDLDYESVFNPIFNAVEKRTKEVSLKSTFKKADLTQLTLQEKRQLQFLIEQENMNYCAEWLGSSDAFLDQLKEPYLKVFSKSPALKDLPFDEAIGKFKSMVKIHPIVQQNRWTINTDLIQENTDYTASFNAEQDADGTIRKASLFFRTGNRIGLSFVPSLSLQTFLVASGHQARIEINHDPKNPDQKIMKKFEVFDISKEPETLYASVPVDNQGRMKINYAGGTNSFPYLPAKELLNGRPTAIISQTVYDEKSHVWYPKEMEVQKAEFIKDRTFIFGATAIGVYDLRVTPFEKNFPGPETHLNTLANLFQKNFIYTHPEEKKIMLWALAIFGCILSLLIAQSGAVTGFLITIASSASIFIIDSYFFKKGYTATMVLPLLQIFTLYIFMTLYKYFTEERKKAHLRSTFSKYVSPAIVDEILKDPENVELGGKKIRMSVFFSDIRGFTTISEKLDPQALSDTLNKYLTPMTQIVFENKGTLDKYMGDAVMAFFGAPIEYPDHAKYACRCALQSLIKLKEIQEDFVKNNLPVIDIGIGINSAEMSVGNMGSDIVRSYTVMGDAVNLGSRLEGINKEYGTRIIISEFTYGDIKDDFTAREVDWVRVKGKYKPVRIFELVCEGAAPALWKDCLEHFNLGFNLYHQKSFKEAKLEFEKALESKTDDPVSKLYVKRCEDYLEEPPIGDWDGVHVMKSK